MTDSIELINNRERTRSDSLDIHDQERSALFKRNDENIFESIDIDSNSKCISRCIPDRKQESINSTTSYKKTCIERYLKFGLHILFHISFLSILEPLLFFNYIIVIENQLFLQQFNHFTENLDPLLKDNNKYIRDQDYYYIFVESLHKEDVCFDSYFEDLRRDAEISNKNNKVINDELESTAFTFFYITITTTFLYYVIFQYFYRKKYLLFKMLKKHIGLMIFIFIYELWFFNTIILKYLMISQEELTYYLMQCIFSRFYDAYPELSFTLRNEKITC
jgi:hypothetical protein